MSKSTSVPDAERDLLAALCRAEQATARELREALEPFRPMAHGSILTLRGRLEAKGRVSKKKGTTGKAFIYRPTAAGRSMTQPVVRTLLQRVFGGSSVSFVASLLESKPPTAEEIEELQELLDELRRRRGKKP
jgi:predicted transcriptional regulator